MTDRSTPAPKPGILDIAPYVGGKAKIEGVETPTKLSSNENALGVSERAREAYLQASGLLHVYPEGRASKLRDAVATTFDLESDRLIFGAGSDEVFSLLNQTYLEPGDNMITGQYGFLAYRISAKAAQAEVRLAPEPDFRVDVDAVLALVDDRTRIVFVSNPSNPTGSWNTAEEIARLHAELPKRVILVVDEAYAEFVTEPTWASALPLARDSENLVVTRTFSKIHGLAALRVGWGYAPHAVAEAVERIRLPFNVNIPAQVAAVEALADLEHQRRSRDLVTEQRPRLIQELRGHGYEVLPSAGNFVMVRLGSPERAGALDHWLQKHGLIVRALGNYGLPDSLRITIGTPEQNRLVLDAMATFAANEA